MPQDEHLMSVYYKLTNNREVGSLGISVWTAKARATEKVPNLQPQRTYGCRPLVHISLTTQPQQER